MDKNHARVDSGLLLKLMACRELATIDVYIFESLHFQNAENILELVTSTMKLFLERMLC